MYAVVMILDAARQRALVHSLHSSLGEAHAACGELRALHPERELTLVELRRRMDVGAVISREHMALGLGVLAYGDAQPAWLGPPPGIPAATPL